MNTGVHVSLNKCMFCDFNKAKNKHYSRLIKRYFKIQKVPVRKVGICILKEDENKNILICSGEQPHPKFCPLLESPVRVDDFHKYRDLFKIEIEKKR